MKNKKHVHELRELNKEQLSEKLENYRRELFSLRLNKVTTHIKDYSQFAKLRKKIAQVMTCLNMIN